MDTLNDSKIDSAGLNMIRNITEIYNINAVCSIKCILLCLFWLHCFQYVNVDLFIYLFLSKQNSTCYHVNRKAYFSRWDIENRYRGDPGHFNC